MTVCPWPNIKEQVTANNRSIPNVPWNLELANGRGFRLDYLSLEGLCFATRRNAATAGLCFLVDWRSRR